MIGQMDKLEIISRHLSGQSNRRIARELGLNRKTVNKYIAEYSSKQEELTGSKQLTQEQIRNLTEEITSAPEYKKRNSPPRKWTKEMDEFLDEILASEDRKRQLLRTNKQQLSCKQIHRLMLDEGFDIGYTSVCNKVSSKKNKHQEAFIAQTYTPGHRFEFDFGEVHLFIDGVYTKAFIAVMIAPYSNYRYARIYRNQNFDVFIDAQVRFFEHLGGCFEEGVYDNMRNVVNKFIGRNEKELTDGLIRFAQYYSFRINVTNCFSGNEKGSVERSVDIVRNAAFAANWQFVSIEDAQRHLDSVLEELNADTLIEEEKRYLSPYRPMYECAKINTCVPVDKYSCVHIDKVSYSVPDCFVGKNVCTKLYPNEVVILFKGKEIAKHRRCFDKNVMVLELNHYLNTFMRKPGALANSTALAAQTQLKEIFDREYKDNPREFISILSECKNQGLSDTINALKSHCALTPVRAQNTHLDAIAAQTLAQIARISAIGRTAS